jgi:aryl-alcohol dehydrogenase-like predicted oxidoreductase
VFVEHRSLGRSGLRVSALCLGTVYFGTQVPEGEAIRIVHQALDLGITFVDTAEIYMRPRYNAAEEILGRALAGRRHEVVLATKKRLVPPFMQSGTLADHRLSRDQIILAIEGSLRRLRTDYVDLYYPHHVDPTVPLDETLRAFDDLVSAGKVRYVGLSNFPAWQVATAIGLAERIGLAPATCVQALYNLLDRSAEAELIPCCAAFGLGFVPYSPLAGGVLTGKYGGPEQPVPLGSRAALGTHASRGRPGHIPLLNTRTRLAARALADYAATRGQSASDLALAWLLQRPAVSSVILGASTVAQLDQNVAGSAAPLTSLDMAEIEGITSGPRPAA